MHIRVFSGLKNFFCIGKLRAITRLVCRQKLGGWNLSRAPFQISERVNDRMQKKRQTRPGRWIKMKTKIEFQKEVGKKCPRAPVCFLASIQIGKTYTTPFSIRKYYPLLLHTGPLTRRLFTKHNFQTDSSSKTISIKFLVSHLIFFFPILSDMRRRQ